MFCTKCGTKAMDGAVFCQKCGAKLIQDNREEQKPVLVPIQESVEKSIPSVETISESEQELIKEKKSVPESESILVSSSNLMNVATASTEPPVKTVQKEDVHKEVHRGTNRHDKYDKLTEFKEYQKYPNAFTHWYGIFLTKRDITLFDCISGIIGIWFILPLFLGGFVLWCYEMSGLIDAILVTVLLTIGCIICGVVMTMWFIRTIHNIRVDKLIQEHLAAGILIELDNGEYVRPRNRTKPTSKSNQ